MKISILGCGWFGMALAKHLLGKGHVVKGSSRTAGKLDHIAGLLPYVVDVSQEIGLDFLDCDALVTCCGAEIGRLPEYQLKRIIYISSTGVYADGAVNENSLPVPKPHYLAEQKLSGANLTVIRFAGLVGPGREPGRFLAGKKDVPNGDAPVNLIHLEDCIGLTEVLLERPDIKLINGVSPDHPSRRNFYQWAAERAGLVPPEFNAVQDQYKLVSTIYPDLYDYRVSASRM